MNRRDFVQLLLVVLLGAVIGVCGSWCADFVARAERQSNQLNITMTGFPTTEVARHWVDSLSH